MLEGGAGGGMHDTLVLYLDDSVSRDIMSPLFLRHTSLIWMGSPVIGYGLVPWRKVA